MTSPSPSSAVWAFYEAPRALLGSQVLKALIPKTLKSCAGEMADCLIDNPLGLDDLGFSFSDEIETLPSLSEGLRPMPSSSDGLEILNTFSDGLETLPSFPDLGVLTASDLSWRGGVLFCADAGGGQGAATQNPEVRALISWHVHGLAL